MSDLHEARVEAAAKALFEESQGLDQGNDWNDPLPDEWRNEWKYVAGEVLAAADAVVTVEMIADRLARELDGNDGDDLGLAHGEGALHLALDFPIREAIEDVYADCGDSDPRVLSTNIAKRLAYLLPPAVLALLRGGEGHDPR